MVAEVERPCGGDRDHHCEQDARDPRPPALNDEDQRETDQSDHCSCRNRLARRDPVHERACLVDQPILLGREPKELRQLPDEDRQGKPVHVSDLRRPRKKVGDEPQLPDPRNDRDDAHQQGQHRRQRDRALGIAAGSDDRQDRRRDHRTQGGIRAQHEDSRRPERCVANQAEDRRVEPGDRRQAGKLSVGHPLGYEQRGEHEAGDYVAPQPRRAIGREHLGARERSEQLHRRSTKVNPGQTFGCLGWISSDRRCLRG